MAVQHVHALAERLREQGAASAKIMGDNDKFEKKSSSSQATVGSLTANSWDSTGLFQFSSAEEEQRIHSKWEKSIKHDLLERVTEVQNIRREDRWITGVLTDGTSVELSGEEVVSMNLWGFTPPVIDLLRRQFRQFLEYWGSDTHAECFLSTSLNDQVELEATRVRVLKAPDTWFGITHAADRARSEAILRERVASGVYPSRLADALARMG